MSRQSGLIVMTLISCLTIRQFASAETSPQASTQKPGHASTQAVAGKPGLLGSQAAIAQPTTPQAPRASLASADLTLDEPPATSTTSQPRLIKLAELPQSVLLQTPEAGEILFEGDASGRSSKVKFTINVANSGINYPVSGSADGSGSEATARATYGLTKNIYLGVGASYADTTSETSANNVPTSFTNVNTKTKNESQGFAEPSLIAGFQTTTSSTRFVGELEGKIPTGASQEVDKVNQTSTDGKSGGGSIIPRLIIVSERPKMRFLGEVSFEVRGERKTQTDDRTQGVTIPYNTTASGGNTLTLGTALELPQMMNWGFLAGYSKSDSLKTKSERSGLESSSDSLGAAVLATYVGIPITSQVMMVPKVAYITTFDKTLNGTTIDQMDIWTFGISTKIRF